MIESNSLRHNAVSVKNSTSTCRKHPSTIPSEPTRSPPLGRTKLSSSTTLWRNTSNSPRGMPWPKSTSRAGTLASLFWVLLAAISEPWLWRGTSPHIQSDPTRQKPKDKYPRNMGSLTLWNMHDLRFRIFLHFRSIEIQQKRLLVHPRQIPPSGCTQWFRWLRDIKVIIV